MDFGEKEENQTRDFVAELKKTLLAKKEEGAKLNPIKEKKKEDLIFGGKPYIPIKDFIRKIKKGSGNIPGWGKKYTEKEKEQVAKESSEGLGLFLEQKSNEPKKIIDKLKQKISNPRTSLGDREEAKRRLSFWKDRFSKK